MRDEWYGDKRDLVKWGSLVSLAHGNSIKDIFVVAYYRNSGPAKLTKDGTSFDLPKTVWNHFRNMDDIQRLAHAEELRIHVFKTPFSHGRRKAYVDQASKEPMKLKGRNKIVFLDPDTGIEPGRPNFKHATGGDIQGFWSALEPSDWLVLYQHQRQRDKNWLETTKKQFSRECGNTKITVFRAEEIVHDVAFFAARK